MRTIKCLILAMLLLSAFFTLPGCTQGDDRAVDNEEGSASMAHICYAAGTTVAIDADSRRIAVSLDLAEQAYAGQTRIFDYSNNPDDGAILNKLEHINQGDAVYINYFDFTNADGSLVGVKIDLYTGQFPFGDEMP